MTALINIGPGSIVITEPADQTLVKDVAMSTMTLTPTGGTAPYVITEYLGDIPVGTTLTTSDSGVTWDVTGTPTVAKTAQDVYFLIVDDDGYAIKSDPINFHVAGDLEISNGLDSATTIEATKSTAFSYQLFNSGGRGNFVWTKASGTYPAGLTVSSSGDVNGTPTAVGSQVLTFTVTDANTQTATTANLTITVNDVLSVTESSFTVYDDEITVRSIIAEDGTEPITFSLDEGDLLPSGLILDQDGKRTAVFIGVVPSGSGNESFTVNVIDANGDTDDTGSITISVSSAPPP